jgi:hypothetical protein
VTGEWRKLHNEELHNLYTSPDIIRQVKSRRMKCAGHVARMAEERKLYKVLVGKPEGKRPFGRPRRRWEDGIRMDLREIGLACKHNQTKAQSKRLDSLSCGYHQVLSKSVRKFWSYDLQLGGGGADFRPLNNCCELISMLILNFHCSS